MRGRWCVLLGLGLLAQSATAWGQSSTPFNRTIDVQSFRPAPGPYNFLTVQGTRVDGHGTLSLGGWVNYALQPFTIYNADCPRTTDDVGCAPGDVRSRPVEHLVTLNLQATLSLAHRVQLSLDLPLSLETGENVDPNTARPVTTTGGVTGSQTQAALGDPRLEVKIRLAGERLEGPGFAVSLFGTIPTGRYTGGEGHFLADDTVSIGGRLVGDFRRGRWSFAANVGAMWRPDDLQILSTYVGSRVLWGAAGGFQFTPRLVGLLELSGASDFTSTLQNNSIEGNLAGRYLLGDLAFTAGLGTGLVRGVGSPVVRAFLGAVWAPYRVDRDRDMIWDNVDRCPTEAEDRDGYEDDDGCPDADNDGDGIADERDRCPDAAEDRDRHQDDDGCPDPDNDNDGVPDGYDSCPDAPEDRDGDRDEDGCPDNDRDRDGIQDDRDRCPTDPEDTDGFEDEDGCPDVDNDRDGIPDTQDQCSDEPETLNNHQDEDGCPDTIPDRDQDGLLDDRDRCPEEAETFNGVEDDDGCPEAREQPLAELSGGRIRILQQINFATSRDRIVGRTSFRVLDAVTAILGIHPEFRRVDIHGHTDNRGNREANIALSQRRANAVRQYLIDHGVAAERLQAHGYGPDRAMEPNTTSRGRAANRRVEFHILPPEVPAQQATQPTTAPTPQTTPVGGSAQP